MAKSYFKLHYDFLDIVEPLTMEERGRLVSAVVEYLRTGRVPTELLTGNERFLFPALRKQADRDSAAYDAQVRRNQANGKKGGRPSAEENNPVGFSETQNNPVGFFETEKTQEKEKENEEEYEKEKEEEKEHEKDVSGCIPAPAQEDVLDYCRKKGLSANGAAFWNYYQANGWTAGGRPIRDWQAKLREWEARDGDQNAARSRPPRASSAPNPALNYQQRDYRPEDYGDGFFIDLDRYGESPG